MGCGVDIAAEQMVAPEEYERMLNWFYDQSLTGDIELRPPAHRIISGLRGSVAPPTGAPVSSSLRLL